jgi:hypothetical protein
VSELSKAIKGLSKLTEEQQQLFNRIHNRHMKAMGTDNQKKYAKENLKKVIWDSKEKRLKVHYEDIWWHYDTRGCWY